MKSATQFAQSEKAVDFRISPDEFVAFRDFFRQKIGVKFADSKRYFVDTRIAERAHANECATFRDYFMFLRADRSGHELQQLINALTVNETYFFRENYQLESLVRFVLPEIAARKRPGDTIRIWSLPCSTGEEPYSIAIRVLDGWLESDRFAIEILASDVDTRVLSAATAGVYGERSLQNVDADVRARYFSRLGNEHQIIRELRESVDFFALNLSNKKDMQRFHDVDVVFCRNLLIYFDDVSCRDAIASIYQTLAPGGFVFLGHSESMSRGSSLFIPRRLGDCTVYQRPLKV